MARTTIAAAVATTLFLGDGALATAQPLDIEWRVQMEKSDVVPDEMAGRRLYVEPDAIELVISLSNRSEDQIYLVEPLLHRALRVRMTLLDGADVSTDVPVVVDWRGLITSRRDPPVVTLPDQWLAVEPQLGWTWSVAVRRVDAQPFAAGRYRMYWQSVDLQTAVRTASGDAWSGRAQSPVRSTAPTFTLVVRPPSTPREEARKHALDADAASRQERWTEAIAFYREAARVDPGWQGAEVPALLILGRYQEAVQILTALPRLSVDARELLFRAYVGVGDETRAADVLRQAGRPEAEIAERLHTWRELVRRPRNAN